ncbi:MBL fold metallo-hydrolase [Pseudohoeflea suaedae]|uniref:MBL fold metallo-hydrolase n=1 Tax=Pseudohoeflea suaedae TaxID=877384 RepID=A0A4R5PLT7_9HYPH|nr:MBL fold metallo-hydrolase [Pseudohoeflea suaedae]TDH36318.1 MBL fold metallo-hydrolase [Pseudohoeflea suaedae]
MNDRSILDRRTLLKSGVCGGLLAVLPAPLLTRRVFAVADSEIVVVSDGNLVLPFSYSFPMNTAEELAPLVGEGGRMPTQFEPACNVTLYRSGDRLVLFDVGSGAHFMPTAGKLLESLDAAGIEPADITDVVFTHGHPDHLWGLIDDFDEEVFTEASYHMNRVEWDYWTDPDTVDSIGEERKTFAVGAASRLGRIEEKVKLFEGAGEVVAGIEAVPTHGHTPGHTSFVIHQGSDATMVTGDAVTHAEISFRHPEWISGADQDPDTAIETRKMLLDRLAADDMRIIGFHLPKPGEGRVETGGGAYRFVAD